jgi:hypothetical protein
MWYLYLILLFTKMIISIFTASLIFFIISPSGKHTAIYMFTNCGWVLENSKKVHVSVSASPPLLPRE